jgi:hypothetical protein
MAPVRAEVTPKADAWIDAARLRGAIKGAGFKPGDLRYTVTGTLTPWRGQPALRCGSDRLLVLQSQPAAPAAYERARQALSETGTKAVEVEGEFVDRAVPEDGSSPASLRLARLEIKTDDQTKEREDNPKPQ